MTYRCECCGHTMLLPSKTPAGMSYDDFLEYLCDDYPVTRAYLAR